MYVLYIRELNSQLEHNSIYPSPPLLLEIRVGYRKETEKAEYRDWKLNVQNPVERMHNTQECVARSLKNTPSLGPRKHPRICGQWSKMAF